MPTSCDQYRLKWKQQVPEEKGPAVHMQGTAGRRIRVADDRSKVCEPESGETGRTDRSGKHRIEDVIRFWLPLAYGLTPCFLTSANYFLGVVHAPDCAYFWQVANVRFGSLPVIHRAPLTAALSFGPSSRDYPRQNYHSTVRQ